MLHEMSRSVSLFLAHLLAFFIYIPFYTFVHILDFLGLCSFSERGVDTPAITDYLDWSSSIQRVYYEQYVAKQRLIEILDYKNAESVLNIQQEWDKISQYHSSSGSVSTYLLVYLTYLHYIYLHYIHTWHTM